MKAIMEFSPLAHLLIQFDWFCLKKGGWVLAILAGQAEIIHFVFSNTP